MARILQTLWQFPTHLQPNIALAHALQDRGHDVAFYSGESVRCVVEKEGFACFPFRAVDDSGVRSAVEQLINFRRNPLKTRKLWRAFLIETMPGQLRDLTTILSDFPADAIVCDLAMWAPMLIIGEKTGLPVAAFSHVATCLLPGPEKPVAGLALPPSRNWLLNLFGHAAAGVANMLGAPVRREVSQFRQQHGLPPLVMSVTEFAGSMPLYLVPSAPEFDYSRKDLPQSVHYVGPCLWDKPKDAPAPDFISRIDPHRPCVVVDEGGLYTNRSPLFQLATVALREAPIQAVLNSGAGRNPSDLKLGPRRDGMMLTPHTPLSDLLPRANLLLTNGNSNSVMAALSRGIPVVVLPSIWDQTEVAWRVHETRTGLRISPRLATAERVRKAILRVLEEPHFRENAVRMAEALHRRGGPAHAAELIEDLIRRQAK